MIQTPWAENDELFRRELEEGHRWASKVGALLEAEGLQVAVTPMEWRATLADADQFASEYDLLVEGQIVDVKSRRLDFTGAHDFPYRTVIVDTVAGWDAKPVKPVAVIDISQKTGGVFVVPVSTFPEWRQEPAYDRVRQIREVNYTVARDLIRPLEDFVTWLRG